MLISFTCCSDSSDYLEEGMTLADQYVSLDKSVFVVKYMSSTQKISVNATCSWEAHSDKNWITFDVAEGSGSSSINIHIEENTDKSYRSGIVTITAGSAKRQITVGQESSYYRDHQFVDLGLPSGLLWATCNIGASNPEEAGGYYAWGETTTKSNYDWSTYKHGTEYNKLTKYCIYTSYGTKDGKKTLESSDDVASVQWNSGWRMPTSSEFDELRTKCTWKYGYMLNNVKGYLVTGLNGNSLFLPLVGYYNGYTHETGFYPYWTSSLDETNNHYALYFYLDTQPIKGMVRIYGCPVRAVAKK